MNNYLLFAGRILLAVIFVLSGFGKLSNPAGTLGYMQSLGIPGILLWPTMALEFLGGLAIVVGFQTRYVALALAAFTLLTAFVAHSNFADQNTMIHFLKILAIAGGFLLLAGSGTSPISIDSRKK